MYNIHMHEIAETIQVLPTYAAYTCAAAVCVCIVGVGALWVAQKYARGGRKVAAASLVGAMLIGAMVVVGTDGAGSKPSTNDVSQVEGGTNTVAQTEVSTNDWTNVEGTNTVGQTDGEGTNGIPGGTRFCASGLGVVRPRGSAALPVVTDDDIAAGWLVVSVSSNMLATATFTMPPHATVWESAQACGRGWGAWHIPIGGWNFTYGDDGWTNGFAWVEGYFCSKFRSRANEIRLLSERLALCPAAHWSRYNLVASRAWSA